MTTPGSMQGSSTTSGAVQDGAPLDALLVDAALSNRRRFLPVGSLAGLAGALGRHPTRLPRRLGTLAGDLARVAVGRSDLVPARDDRRFTDPAWSASWLFRRVLQAYFAAGRATAGLIDDAHLEPAREQRVRFATQNVLDALAPTNFWWSNPTALKVTIDEGGMNLVRGVRHALSDLPAPPHLPAMVDRSAFRLGGNVAVTPGAVIHRRDAYELIQYRPQTDQVRSVPLVIVPPMINKYYIIDLAPDRSLVEHCIRQGQQVFVISWRNPEAAHRHWGFNAYADAISDAIDVASAVTGAESAHLLALCSGGAVTAGLAGHLAARGDLGRVAGLTLGVCMLDQRENGQVGALASPNVLAAARAASAREGYLDGRALAGVFAWLRPNDLIWNYVVNNYLLGRKPPAFDILYWNADTVRMAAGLHHDFLHLAAGNGLVNPGTFEVLGSPVDLGKVDVDAYVIAGVADHICPWETCYRTTGLLGGQVRFVLSTSGHIAALVNPPGNPKSRYQVSDGPHPDDASAWQRETPMLSGTWWDDWDAWLAQRSGPLRDAPGRLGDDAHPEGEPAPGTYVLAP